MRGGHIKNEITWPVHPRTTLTLTSESTNKINSSWTWSPKTLYYYPWIKKSLVNIYICIPVLGTAIQPCPLWQKCWDWKEVYPQKVHQEYWEHQPCPLWQNVENTAAYPPWREVYPPKVHQKSVSCIGNSSALSTTCKLAWSPKSTHQLTSKRVRRLKGYS